MIILREGSRSKRAPPEPQERRAGEPCRDRASSAAARTRYCARISPRARGRDRADHPRAGRGRDARAERGLVRITMIMRRTRRGVTERNRHPYATCDGASYLFGRSPPTVHSTQSDAPRVGAGAHRDRNGVACTPVVYRFITRRQSSNSVEQVRFGPAPAPGERTPRGFGVFAADAKTRGMPPRAQDERRYRA
jgi:hypothetical protein